MVDLTLLNQTGFLIPFLFVMAVVFGVLRIANVFKGNPAVEMIIALVIAFFAATYQPFTSVLLSYLPGITWFFVAMFFLVFVLEIFGIRGKKAADKESAEKNMIIYGILLLLLFSIGVSGLQGLPVQLPLIGGGENIALLVGLIFIIGIFWYAYNIQAPQQPQQKGG